MVGAPALLLGIEREHLRDLVNPGVLRIQA
jgi:hypothetical protein